MSSEVAKVIELLCNRRTVVLTGAGCSTESGIPDYRGPETARRARNPITFQQYVRDPGTHRRYWARSAMGWPRLAEAQPNPAHHALAALEKAGHISGIITQNVDRLHTAAGSERVIELHGALADVHCRDCGAHEARADLQLRILEENPTWTGTVELAPDGDAEVSEDIDTFVVPVCLRCYGQLKPTVVFFGENVPATTRQAAFAMMDEADALLVVGSSLTVYSGRRFVVSAAERALPIGIVNLGETRGDELADFRVGARAGELLPQVARALGCQVPHVAA